MSWETRANGRKYYTRSRLVGGKVQREYVGCGSIGELAESLDLIERAEREMKANAIREVKLQAELMDERLREFESLVECIGRGILIAAGYHQHKRSEWRKRHEQE